MKINKAYRVKRIAGMLGAAVLIQSGLGVAGDYPAMNQQDMQKMMAVLAEVGQCMQQIDQKELERLQQRSIDFGRDAKQLCDQGKTTQAQQLASQYAEELSTNKTVKQLTECSAPLKTSLQGMLPAGAVPEMPDYAKTIDDLHKGVCSLSQAQ